MSARMSAPLSEIAIANTAERPAAAGLRLQRLKSFLRRASRESFLHFLLLGAVLFAVNERLEERSKFTHITVTQQTVRGIAENYRLQYGVTPTAHQLDNLVDEYVREEVFYHEALKLGLDRDDEIIRRRLVQKYEFLQQDLGLAHEPTETELRRYYTEHQQDYRTPARVSFTHVYFSPDARGEEAAKSDALRLASSLNAQGITRAVDHGDRFPGPTDFAAASTEELSRVFGKEGLAAEVLSVTPGLWAGPLHSGLGWHIVFVNGQRPEEQATFEAAEETVRRDFLDAIRAKRNAEVYANLKRGFAIVRE